MVCEKTCEDFLALADMTCDTTFQEAMDAGHCTAGQTGCGPPDTKISSMCADTCASNFRRAYKEIDMSEDNESQRQRWS